MTRLGFLLSKMGATQLSLHLLQGAASYLRDRTDVDILVFYQNIVKCWQTPTFGMLNISEIYDFTGAAVATDLDTAEKLQRAPGPKGRYFYLWDLEWMRGGGWSYERMARVYCDPNLTLIVRSDRHKAVAEDSWNRPVGAVIPQCDLAAFAALVA